MRRLGSVDVRARAAKSKKQIPRRMAARDDKLVARRFREDDVNRADGLWSAGQMVEGGFRGAESLGDAAPDGRAFEVIPGDKNAAMILEFALNRLDSLRVPQIVLRQRFCVDPDLLRSGRSADLQHFFDFDTHLVGNLFFAHL